MGQQNCRTLLSRALIGAAYFVMLLTVAPPAFGQDTVALEPVDGYFPRTRSDVIELQELLTRFGYNVGPIDGVVGPQTVAAHYTTLVRFGLIWRHGSIAVIGSVRNSLRI